MMRTHHASRVDESLMVTPRQTVEIFFSFARYPEMHPRSADAKQGHEGRVDWSQLATSVTRCLLQCVFAYILLTSVQTGS